MMALHAGAIMRAEPYILASSDTVILIAQDLGDGTSRVTVWTRGDEEWTDRAGARVCAQHADGQWSRVDLRPFIGDGIPLPWVDAWTLGYELVPELMDIAMRTSGAYLLFGDAIQRVEAVRARVKRARERKRAGQKVENVEETKTDQGPTGLGGSRWS